MTTIDEATMTNFQRLNYVQIAPRGTLVAICGRNGQGKTAFMDGIVATLLGQNKRDFPTPVHDGADKATTELVLSNGMHARRRFNPDASSTLTAKAADGKPVPQATIDGMISAIGIDTGLFLDLPDKKQLETLLDMLEMPFVPAELEAERKEVFDQRTEASRKAKELTAQIARFLEIPADLPAEETSVAALAEEIRAAEQTARVQAGEVNQLARARDHEASLVQQLAQVREAIGKLAPIVDAHEQIPDLDNLHYRMSTSEDTNAMVRVAKEKADLEFQLLLVTGDVDRATEKLKAIDQKKRDGLAATIFPATGMSFDEDGVLLNGRPLRKASTGEYAEAMVEMIIASDPELKVIIVRNGNDLDSERLARIEAMGDAAGFQIFAEFVDESGEFGWTISDGKLAA
ncbi:AAA family ATPase [Paeniglutamicibacter sp. R2-26]|uniref:AAA family ATPase n=1 Tax=Paeniglutamicibacter sp. R2-26 TaxID=3144417 RepID=UPI003EE6BAF5